jgi:hypothetical protein
MRTLIMWVAARRFAFHFAIDGVAARRRTRSRPMGEPFRFVQLANRRFQMALGLSNAAATPGTNLSHHLNSMAAV